MKRILAIDDEAGVCRTIKKSLEATGEFEVSICTDSREAFQKVLSVEPDVIVLDVQMPYLSGPQVVEQLEADEATQNIPIVYLTGVSAESEVLERENVIGGNFVGKPFKTGDLIRAINLVAKS